MRLPGGWGPSDEAQEQAVEQKSLGLLDLLLVCCVVVFAVSLVLVLVAQFFTFMNGASSPDVTTGRTYLIYVLSQHGSHERYVTPQLGQIYDLLALPGEIAGAGMILLLGVQWLIKPKTLPTGK
jgi:hypothetical protein